MNLWEQSSVYLPLLSPSLRRKVSQDPSTVLVIPLGATEQHGPHLPLCTDSTITTLMLEKLLSRHDRSFPLIIAPPLWITKSNEHSGFPGTLDIGADGLTAWMESMLDTCSRYGFTRIAVLNGHGGNLPVLERVRLMREAEEQGSFRILKLYPTLSALSAREARWGIHGGEVETSLLYHAAPDLCRPDKADCVWISDETDEAILTPEGTGATFAWMTRDLSPSGTMGDATIATSEKGAVWADEMAAALYRQIKDISG